MRKGQIYELTITAMFLAIIVVMSLVPYLGFVPNPLVPGASITLIHIPVIIGGILIGRRKSWFLGLFFGLMSLVIAFLRPQGPVDIIFRNPLVSVFPRLVFGIVIYELYNLLSKFIKNRAINISITMVLSTLIHTILVVIMLYIFGRQTMVSEQLIPESISKNIIVFFTSVFLVSGLLEAGLALIIGTPTTTALLVFSEKSE